MERVGEDLGHPHQAGLHVSDEEQVHGAEQQAAHAQREPQRAHLADERHAVRVRLEQAEHAGSGPHQQRRAGPQGHQHHLAAQVVTDLDLFLVFVRGLVHVVVALGLEEEMAGLAAGHGHEPGDQRRQHGVGPQQGISHHEAHGADEVQRLVDAAVVVIAVVVPALDFKGLEKIVHGGSRGLLGVASNACHVGSRV
ncbi:hypothetical protein ACFJGX_22740 [Hydrogenophaga sp. UC242_50]|uniref:hypothetical protein n=1 Tax=Hydrogenophaga sp. UC242_50 TaxID=3350169 RepID=UPI0036D30BC2